MNDSSNFISLSDLNVLSRENNSGIAVVMLHGYGANAFDLLDLKDVIGPLTSASWFFPQAPLSLPMGHFEGRAWFPIDIEAMQSRSQGASFGLEAYCPQELLDSGKKIAAMINLLKQKHPRIILGGFSQGAMMALEVTLGQEVEVEGLMLFSTGPVAWKRWQLAIENKKKWPWIFQSHGKLDPILPFDHAHKLFSFLGPKLAPRQFIAFQGGHEIPPKVLRSFEDFLQQHQLSQPKAQG